MSGVQLAQSYAPWREASAPRRLVIVAESSAIVNDIQTAVRRSGEFELVGRVDPREAAADLILATEPDVVLLDDAGRSEGALALVRTIREHDSTLALIVLGRDLCPAWLDRAFGAGAIAAISAATQPGALVTLVCETIDGHIVHRTPATAASSRGVHGSSSLVRNAAGARLSLVATATTSAR